MTDEVKPIDLSDPRDVQDARKRAKKDELVHREALRAIMSTPQGRKWILSLLERCHPFESAFSRDPIMMAHNCGEANIGLQLIAELHACSVELYLLMMKESQEHGK